MLGLVLVSIGGLISLVFSIIILVDAFKKSVGTGFMTLCIPCYILYYMFSVFEHEKKGLIVGGYFTGVLLNVIGQVLTRGGAGM